MKKFTLMLITIALVLSVAYPVYATSIRSTSSKVFDSGVLQPVSKYNDCLSDNTLINIKLNKNKPELTPIAKKNKSDVPKETIAEVESTEATECLDVVEQETVVLNEEQNTPQTTLEGMPLFDQQDYPDVKYGSGNIATDGCGIVCMAMVSSYLLGETHYPEELALAYNDSAINYDQKMENAARGLGLKWEKSCNWYEMVDHIKDGKICIALMTNGSLFTYEGHFIVITGITEDGKFLVNDPMGKNYDRYPDGFKNGFENWEMLKGWSGVWVFDPNDYKN